MREPAGGARGAGPTMTRNRLIQLLATLGVLVCLSGAALLVDPLREQANQTRLPGPAPDKPAEAPAQMADSVPAWVALALSAGGPFRGCAIHYLWYERSQLKEDGKYYAANTYSEWITSLQPYFPAVWYYQAWDMAYNISVNCNTVEERWDWVSKGINLLRDRGVVYNPKAVVLYKELGWIFLHKVGQVSDDMHWYYKYQVALEWQEVLGAPPGNATTPQVLERFRAVAEAPETLEKLLAASPAARPLVERLQQEGYALDTALLRQIGGIQMFSQSVDARALGLTPAGKTDWFDPKLVDILADRQLAAGLDPLLAYLRKQALRTTYHMDPEFMYQLMKPQSEGGYGFGPLDWRHPATHALYWSALGVRVAATVYNKKEIDLLNTDREVIQSLQALTDTGRISFDPASRSVQLGIDYSPDPRFIPAYELAVFGARQRADAAAADEHADDQRRAAGSSFDTGHENFLVKAVVYCYFYGDEQEAEQYRQRARRLYQNKFGHSRNARYDLPLQDFVLTEVGLLTEVNYYSRQVVDAFILRAFIEGLATGRTNVYKRFLGMAQYMHEQVQQQAKGAMNPNATRDRLGMLPFEDLKAEIYTEYMLRPGVNLLLRARIWHNTPADLQQRTYDRLRPALAKECQEAGAKLERAFPEPKDMDQYRATHPNAAPAPAPGSPTTRPGSLKVETQ